MTNLKNRSRTWKILMTVSSVLRRQIIEVVMVWCYFLVEAYTWKVLQLVKSEPVMGNLGKKRDVRQFCGVISFHLFSSVGLTYSCILWGNNYEAPLSQLVKLQNKATRIINNVPIRDHVTPHYVGLGLIKLPDIIKLSMCQLFYDHIVDKKSSNFALSFVSEIHDYATRSTSLHHLNHSPFRINIRKFFPTVIGMIFLCLYGRSPLKNFLKEHFSHITFSSTD